VGGAGFLLGLSPRIASILMGETSQGGQGHDFDFLPTKLLAHSYDLLALKGPELLGLDRSFQDLVSNPIGTYWVIHCALLLFLVAVFLLSAFFFIFENRTPLKSIVTLRGMQFNAAHIILLAPILVCMANIATQNGPMPRYLFPLFGIFTLWIGICVDKIQEKVKWLPILVMVMWVSFYSITNYHAYQAAGLIEEGGKPVKLKKHFIYDVLDFLESKKIPVAYSDYGLAGMGTFLSGGEINISEYSNDPKAKARKERSMSHLRFAVIAKDGPAAIYKSYFQEKRIKFQTVSVAGYEIFWDFAGRGAEINNLRSLIFEI
jgi:hypothetical protein